MNASTGSSAYRLHSEAANLVAIELARGGEIGEPRIILSALRIVVLLRMLLEEATLVDAPW